MTTSQSHLMIVYRRLGKASFINIVIIRVISVGRGGGGGGRGITIFKVSLKRGVRGAGVAALVSTGCSSF